jgi:hypothetical protein
MRSYRLTIYFDNLDNFLGTDAQARAHFTIEADNYSHAVLLASRFLRVFDADRWDLE